MKPNRHVNREFRLALDGLHALIDLTHEAIEQQRRKDPAMLVRLIDRQRRNFRLLLHKLEKERENGK